jgi:hypothetical protein
MAEIRVERKPRRNIWPWILGLIVVALVVWGLVAMNDNRREPAQQSSLTSVTFAAPSIQLEQLIRAA